jgi:hypothetical protein
MRANHRGAGRLRAVTRRGSKLGGKRPGAGRPRSTSPVRDRQVMLRLTADELAAARAAAIRDGRVTPGGKPVVSDWYRAAGALAIARGSTR